MAKRHGSKVGDFESIFLRLEELVLANSGEDEFEEVFKLLVAKLWDEQTGKAPAFRPYRESKQTYEAIRGLLQAAEKAWPGVLEAATEPGLHQSICTSVLMPFRVTGFWMRALR